MKNIKRFLIIALSVIMAVPVLSSCGKQAKSDETAVLPQMKVSAKEIYLFDRGNLSNEEYVMLSSLQGVTAQQEAQIYIKDNDNMIYLERGLQKNKSLTVIEYTDLWKLISDFSGSLKNNGCVLFEDGANATVNMAATVAGAECWLAVPLSLKERAVSLGLTVMLDLTEKENGEYKLAQRDIFEKYKDVLNNNLVIHQSPELVTLRDYGIASKAFCFYTDEASKSDKKFRDEVFAWAEMNAPVLGWSADELGYVKQASKNGLYVVPSDHCTNLSFLSGWDTDAPTVQKAQMQNITADPSKHYVAFIMSDGDNVQWYETSFMFREHFHGRIENPQDYKLTWTAPPLLKQLAPSVMSVIYNAASPNDAFVAGVSGMGYINPTNYPNDNLKSFVNESVTAADRANLSTIVTLDNTTSKRKLKKAMSVYAENEQIDGGFMQIGDKYEELGGKIIWCGDKPFISAGKSFWYIGENPDEKVTREFTEQFAAEINELPADVTSEDGYTYINIHPWSTTIDDLNYLVSLLDEDVEIVFAEEMLQLIKNNVKH